MCSALGGELHPTHHPIHCGGLPATHTHKKPQPMLYDNSQFSQCKSYIMCVHAKAEIVTCNTNRIYTQYILRVCGVAPLSTLSVRGYHPYSCTWRACMHRRRGLLNMHIMQGQHERRYRNQVALAMSLPLRFISLANKRAWSLIPA